VALIFSQDKTKWWEMSRHVRMYSPPAAPPAATSASVTAGGARATPGTDSRGTGAVQASRPERPDQIIGMPPGEYYAVAVDDLPAETPRDATLSEGLVGDAVRVTLRESPSPAKITRRRHAMR
jgi:hypothetical protein